MTPNVLLFHIIFFGYTKQVLTIISAYLIFSMKLGPWLMRDRPPFNIRPIVIVYNIFMVWYTNDHHPFINFAYGFHEKSKLFLMLWHLWKHVNFPHYTIMVFIGVRMKLLLFSGACLRVFLRVDHLLCFRRVTVFTNLCKQWLRN